MEMILPVAHKVAAIAITQELLAHALIKIGKFAPKKQSPTTRLGLPKVSLVIQFLDFPNLRSKGT